MQQQQLELFPIIKTPVHELQRARTDSGELVPDTYWFILIDQDEGGAKSVRNIVEGNLQDLYDYLCAHDNEYSDEDIACFAKLCDQL